MLVSKQIRQTGGNARAAFTAFTLVELLVVIGIIAVLISILLPALSKARESANTVKCAANLHTIGISVYIYAGDNKNTLPIGFAGQGQTIDLNGVTWQPNTTDWTVLIAYELNKNSGADYTDGKTLNFNNGTRGFFICPSAPQTTNAVGNILTDYGSHPRLIPNLSSTDPATVFVPPYTKNYFRPYKLSRIKYPSDIALIFDASLANEQGSGYWNAHVVTDGLDNGAVQGGGRAPYMSANYYSSTVTAGTPINTADGNGSGFATKYYNTDTEQNLGNIRFRHAGNKKANSLMADGHVQSFNYNPVNQTTDMLEKNICASQ